MDWNVQQLTSAAYHIRSRHVQNTLKMGRNAVAVDTLATCLGSVHRSLYQIRLHVLEAMVATVAMGGEWSR